MLDHYPTAEDLARRLKKSIADTRRTEIRKLAAWYLLEQYGELTHDQAKTLVPQVIQRACVVYDATRYAEVPNAT